MDRGTGFAAAAAFFPAPEAAVIRACRARFSGPVYEIRLYAEKAVAFATDAGLLFCGNGGSLSPVPGPAVLRPSARTLYEVLNRAAGYALYAHEAQTRAAFLTKNGCRIGVSGLLPDGTLSPGGLRSLCIRIPYAGDVRADPAAVSFAREPDSLLIAGAPGAGKTTFLKKLIYALCAGACGGYRKTAVIDTRGEFADYIAGTPEILTADAICFGDQTTGIQTALRLFSPEVLLCDEVGLYGDVRALTDGANAGVRMIASIHAGSEAELIRRPQFRALASNGVFRRVLFLSASRVGEVAAVSDAADLAARMRPV